MRWEYILWRNKRRRIWVINEAERRPDQGVKVAGEEYFDGGLSP